MAWQQRTLRLCLTPEALGIPNRHSNRCSPNDCVRTWCAAHSMSLEGYFDCEMFLDEP